MPKNETRAAAVIQTMKNELWREERRIDRLQAYIEDLDDEIYGLTGKAYSEPAILLYREQKARAERELADALEISMQLMNKLYRLKAIELPEI